VEQLEVHWHPTEASGSRWQKIEGLPVDIPQRSPWSITFTCRRCAVPSTVFAYDPARAVWAPLQDSFARLVSCKEHYYGNEGLTSIAAAFATLSIDGPIGERRVVRDGAAGAFSKRPAATLAYSKCVHCGQPYLAAHRFTYPDNERAQIPDPVVCIIDEIIQANVTFEPSIHAYIKLRNRSTPPRPG